MSPRPYLVILTGGGLPSDNDRPDPHPNDVALALHRAGVSGDLAPARAAAAEGFKVGYHQAAMLYRVVAVYAVDDPAEAQVLAAAVTREIDPAYVTHAQSPLAEALSCYRQARTAADEQVPDAEIVDEKETG